MKASSQALLAALALGASLSMTGCGLPDFVYAFCEESLAGPMAQASEDGLNKVQKQCAKTFKAESQINLCVYEGTKTLAEARSNIMPTFRDQCAQYVETTVCTQGAECGGKPEKITPAQAQPAVNAYVSSKGKLLAVRMNTELAQQIERIITKDYDIKFANRQVPLTIQAQCANEITKAISKNPALTNDPITEIYRVCFASGGSDSTTVRTCQNDALNVLTKLKSAMQDREKMSCASYALNVACPKGSVCAIETQLAEADTTKTAQAAVGYMWQNWQTWEVQYKASLMTAASHWHFVSRKYTLFEMPAWQGNSLLALGSVVAVVGGIGLFITVRRLARKSARAVGQVEATETAELIEDPEQ